MAVESEVHLNDVGTIFEITLKDGSTPTNISSPVTLQIIFRKPNKALLTKTAALVTDGIDGKLRYIAIAGDLDLIGKWSIQASIALASGSWKSEISTFQVFRNL